MVIISHLELSALFIHDAVVGENVEKRQFATHSNLVVILIVSWSNFHST